MFTNVHLEELKRVARKQKNQGEISVYGEMQHFAMHIGVPSYLNETKLNIIKYCAEECKRQRSGEMSVYDMLVAWNHVAKWIVVPLTLDIIEQVGQLVEPIDNKNGFRTIPIFVGNATFGYTEKAEWSEVPRLLTLLLESYYEGHLTFNHEKAISVEDQFYFEYENIHPFRDGNGRSGKILYNYLKGTLDNPVMPPNFWNTSNP